MNRCSGMVFVLATSALARMRGLLFSRSDWGCHQRVLVLIPCKGVHTFGMRYALDIAFVRENGVVMRSFENVPANRLLKCSDACFVLERPHVSGEPWFAEGDAVPLALHHAVTPLT